MSTVASSPTTSAGLRRELGLSSAATKIKIIEDADATDAVEQASYLNNCAYCLDSYAFFLKMQGSSDETVAAFMEGNLDKASLTDAERSLLKHSRSFRSQSVRGPLHSFTAATAN